MARPIGADEEISNMENQRVWSGPYPLAELHRFDGAGRVSCLRDSAAWQAVWTAFQPQAPVPEVDFVTHVIVVVRNVEFLNAIRLRSVVRDGETLKVEISETRTARPLTSTLQCLMVLADVRGVSCIECSGQSLSV